MVGVDEVGRGCLAGPMLVVAARSKSTRLPAGLKDSKQLTRIQREKIYASLNNFFEFGVGWVEASEIDKFGLPAGLRLGAKRSLEDIKAKPSEPIVLDGSVNYLPKKYKNAMCVVKADASDPIVAAASIYAKVTRDLHMINLGKSHPNFSFSNHVGYGTAEHYRQISEFGPIKTIHRLSFAPFKETTW